MLLLRLRVRAANLPDLSGNGLQSADGLPGRPASSRTGLSCARRAPSAEYGLGPCGSPTPIPAPLHAPPELSLDETGSGGLLGAMGAKHTYKLLYSCRSALATAPLCCHDFQDTCARYGDERKCSGQGDTLPPLHVPRHLSCSGRCGQIHSRGMRRGVRWGFDAKLYVARAHWPTDAAVDLAASSGRTGPPTLGGWNARADMLKRQQIVADSSFDVAVIGAPFGGLGSAHAHAATEPCFRRRRRRLGGGARACRPRRASGAAGEA
jgi:hypothetical protein